MWRRNKMTVAVPLINYSFGVDGGTALQASLDSLLQTLES